jgi:hypothetical protein
MSQDFKQASGTSVVTMAIGSEYQGAFERWYRPSWQDYCRRQGFDLHVIDQPIDKLVDLSRKSLHWQKLLIPSLPQFRDYERVIWVDADIVINSSIAPDITEGVSPKRIGVVDATRWMTTPDDIFNQYSRFLFLDALSLTFKDMPRVDDCRTLIADMTVADMYRLKGFDPPVDQYVNTGVLVCSPHHHADYLLDLYLRYESDIWDFENTAVSWELISQNIVDFIDERFNVVWAWEAARHYPFVFNHDFYNANTDLIRMCVNTAFRNAFFLHLAGPMAKALACAIDTGAENIAALIFEDYKLRSAGIEQLSCADAEKIIGSTGNVRWPF